MYSSRRATLTFTYPLIAFGVILFQGYPAQAEDEQAFRNELGIQRDSVKSKQETLKDAKATLEKKKAAVAGITSKRSDLKRRQNRLAADIQTKEKAKELTERRLRSRIGKLEQELQAAVDEKKPSAELLAIQKQTNGLRDRLKATATQFQYQEKIAALKKQWDALQAEDKKLDESLLLPTSAVGDAVEAVADAEKSLRTQEANLRKMLSEGRETLASLAPPILKEITVTNASGRKVYAAHWNPGLLEADHRISNLEKLIIEQQKVINDRERQSEFFFREWDRHQKRCNELMAKYTDEVWAQAWNSIAIEMADSALTICWDLPEMGPYAVALEAGDRLIKVATGTAARDYSIPDEGAINAGLASTFDAQKAGSNRNAIKSAIKGVIGTAAIPAGASDFIGYGTSGLSVTREGGNLTSIKEGLGHVYHSALQLKGKSGKDVLTGMAGEVDVSGAWKGMQKNLDEKLFKKGAATASDFGTGFVRDQVQGAVIEELLSQAESGRRYAWTKYAREDALRSVALASYKSIRALRRVDQEVMDTMTGYLDELIADRNKAKEVRSLVRTVDEVLEQGKTYNVSLIFDRRNVSLESVTIGGLPVSISGSTAGANWSGSIDIESLPTSALISVKAKDPDTGKELDAPITVAHFNATAENWAGYEPGPDNSHRLRLTKEIAKRSFVFVVDCSSSMKDNNRLEVAKASARNLFNNGRFKQDDEIALYVFGVGGGMGVTLASDFTLDHQRILTTIEGLGPSGGTPLARSIKAAGAYLYTHGTGKDRSLIVLTDGADSEGGNVGDAISWVRAMRQQVEIY